MHLPDELLQRIFECLYISGNCDRCDPPNYHDDKLILETLSNVSLASKSFSELARPALFRMLDFQRVGTTRLWSVLRILCQNPKYCTYVQVITIPTWEVENGETVDGDLLLSQDQVDLVLERLELPEDILVRLKEGLTEGFPGAGYSLLLALCTKLRRLVLDCWYSWGEDLFATSFLERIPFLTLNGTNASAALMPYQCIEEVEVSHGNFEEPTTITNFANLLSLPALRTLQCGQVSFDTTEDDFDLPNTTSTVQHIQAWGSLMNGPGLEKLLRACPALRTLAWDWGNGSIDESNFTFPQLGNVLRRHGTDLITLVLDSENISDEHHEEQRDKPLGRLSALSKLKHLHLTLNALFQDPDNSDDFDDEEDGHGPTEPSVANDNEYLVNILPPSLETLRIGSAGIGVDDQDMELHDSQLLELMHHPSFKNLIRIEIHRRVRFSKDLSGTKWQATQEPPHDSEGCEPWQVLQRRGMVR